MATLAFQAAAGHYADALEAHRLGAGASDEDPLDLRVAHGRALRLAGAPEAVCILLETADAAEAAGDARMMAEALLALTLTYSSEIAAHSALTDLLRRALELLGDEDADMRAHLMGVLALEGADASEQDERERLAREALATARQSASPPALARALIACEWVSMHPAAAAERLSLAGQLLSVADAHALSHEKCMGYAFRFMASLELGDAPSAITALEAAARTSAQVQGTWAIAFLRAAWTATTGRLQQAEQEAAAARELGQSAGIDESILATGFTGQLACIRIQQGRLGELEAPLTELAATQPFHATWRATLAKLCCDQGRFDEARTAFAAAIEHPALRSPRHDQWSTTLALLAEVARVLDERAAADKLFALLRPFAGMMTWNPSCTLGPFDLALGRLAAATGDRAEAARRLRTAVTLCERMGAEGWLAIARHELAGVSPEPDRRLLDAAARADAERLGIAFVAADRR
jgi:tetratricopeptide (TPR) repeat protein